MKSKEKIKVNNDSFFFYRNVFCAYWYFSKTMFVEDILDVLAYVIFVFYL